MRDMWEEKGEKESTARFENHTIWVNTRHVGAVHTFNQQRAVHTLHIEFAQITALRGSGGGAVNHSISNHLQWRGAHTVRVCVCKYTRISVTVLSFNPLQHAESWKLLPDIHKQWPSKTMQTRCLGSFPCPRVQQLAELLLPPPTALDLQRKNIAPSVDLWNHGAIPLQLSRNQIIPHWKHLSVSAPDQTW